MRIFRGKTQAFSDDFPNSKLHFSFKEFKVDSPNFKFDSFTKELIFFKGILETKAAVGNINTMLCRY